MEIIEIAALDLRFEHARHKDSDTERRLLTSIMERDIQEPLQVSVCQESQTYVLLDGFKRYRCAKKLDMGTIPVECIADNVVSGVVSLLRRESAGGLDILEQAALIEELHRKHGLSIYEIAVRLEHSPSWVSMRLGMLEDLSDFVREKIMSGAFPARAYMYGIKGFTRVNNIPQRRVDAFVEAVSGKRLSTRELFVLSRAYFTGGTVIEQLIREGDVYRAVYLLNTNANGHNDSGLTDPQRFFVTYLSSIADTMVYIMAKTGEIDRDNASFMQYINLWSATIIKRLDEFSIVIKELYDRSGPTGGGVDLVSSGSKPQRDSAAVAP
jgi:hypothetical protein